MLQAENFSSTRNPTIDDTKHVPDSFSFTSKMLFQNKYVLNQLLQKNKTIERLLLVIQHFVIKWVSTSERILAI